MPTYQLTNTASLAHETGRVKGVLLVNLKPGKIYTVEELLELLHSFGLDYTPAQLAAIRAALITDGTIQQNP